jgi:hypothetical protein
VTIYANRSAGDVVRNAFYKLARRGDVLCLASPFFSNDALVREVADRGCDVRLVVRLGPSTDPRALGRCIRHERIQVRFFTSRRFHPKVYIFGDHAAVIGSANMTEAGTNSNHEVCVSVSPESEDFDELVGVFQSYWDSAEVLTKGRLEDYERLYAGIEPATADAKLERDVVAAFGDVAPGGGIRVANEKPSKDRVFLENYRRTYQEFLAVFRALEQEYRRDGRRQQPEEIVPLRIELDLFLSFIRKTFAGGDGYLAEPLRDREGRAARAREHFDQWFHDRWPYLDDHTPGNYAKISRLLGSRKVIEKASAEDLFDALDVCHSFHDRFRFYSGGHATMRKRFLADNDVRQVKKVLTYLLYGEGDFVDRMGTCIFSPEYKLAGVGRSVVQEVFGWVNGDDVPICNGRTVKSLRYLGGNVKIFT